MLRTTIVYILLFRSLFHTKVFDVEVYHYKCFDPFDSISFLISLFLCCLFNRLVGVGAVLDANANVNKQVIQYAIERANKVILDGEDFQLTSEFVEVPYGNEFTTSKAICELLEVIID